MRTRRLHLSELELRILADALRDATANGLYPATLAPVARGMLDRLDAKLPSAAAAHRAGPEAGVLVVGDEILRWLLAYEDRYGAAALTREQISEHLDGQPPGTSIRTLLDELCRSALLGAEGKHSERRYRLTRHGRELARALVLSGLAPTSETLVVEPEDLLDLVYADSTACGRPPRRRQRPVRAVAPSHRAGGRRADRHRAARHRELAAGRRADRRADRQLRHADRQRAAWGRERWYEAHPDALSGPPRPTRPFMGTMHVQLASQDRFCPNCAGHASWLSRRGSRRWVQLHHYGHADYTCTCCEVRWSVYLEGVGRDSRYDPEAVSGLFRPRWRYLGGLLHDDQLAPPDHHPTARGT